MHGDLPKGPPPGKGPQPRHPAGLASGRRSLLGLSGLAFGMRPGLPGLGLSSLGLVACAGAPSQAVQDRPGAPSVSGQSRVLQSDTGFRFDGGIGRNPGGPDRWRYAEITGRYGTASASTWWRVESSVDSFSRLDQILDSRASAVTVTPALNPTRRAPGEPEIRYRGAGPKGTGDFTIDDYCSRNPVTGLLIAMDGKVLVERYQYDRGPEHRMTSFSMAKTLTAMLAGLALAQGRIDSIDDPAERYAPGLRGTEYGRTPLRHLLTLSSGVRFREEYDGTDDSAILTRRSIGFQSAGGTGVVAPFNQLPSDPGAPGYYASSETFLPALFVPHAFDDTHPRCF